ncbi:MAG: DNA repair exonuclease [Ruminococcaceae bacterium]|nr:DNA repair exonuclease [Oscillospiraceae bacterium]
MKVVICADAHLDSPFSMFHRSDVNLSIRHQEQRQAFTKAIDEVKRIGAELLLIPGDLFDGRKASVATIKFLVDAFASIPGTYVVIAPGNHDPYTEDSPYATESWPENVCIFKKELEMLELPAKSEESIRIYGGAFCSHFATKNLLRQGGSLPELDKSKLNILLMHTALEAGSKYNPITKDDLDQCGFDFCALGHVHKYSGVIKTDNTTYAYPGVPEGRGFDEPDECGILSGTISKEEINLSFVETSVRKCRIVEIDVTDCDSNERVAELIREKCPDFEYSYKVILKGTVNDDFNLSPVIITGAVSQQYFYIKVISKCRKYMDTQMLARENSLRGFFIKNCLERMEAVGDIDDDRVAFIEEAMQFGLDAFEGDVIIDEN